MANETRVHKVCQVNIQAYAQKNYINPKSLKIELQKSCLKSKSSAVLTLVKKLRNLNAYVWVTGSFNSIDTWNSNIWKKCNARIHKFSMRFL